jgi:hypothetical protein
MALLEEVYRLPMVPPRDASRQKIREVLSALESRRKAAGRPAPASATA